MSTPDACRSLACKNVQRSLWQGSRSRLPFALEVLVGVAVWCAYRIADRWTAHIEHVRKVTRSHSW